MTGHMRMSSEIKIRADSLEERDGYGFFAPEPENQYQVAADNLEANREALKEQFFTGELSETNTADVNFLNVEGILEKPAEYTQGHFDEAGYYGEDLILWAVLIIAACAASFFAAIQYGRYKRKKADKCTSQ
jgi:hypothetical protein